MRLSSFVSCGLLCLIGFSSCVFEDAECLSLEPQSVVFRASFADEHETRTSFGSFTSTGSYAEIQWDEGDAVKLFYVPKSSDPASARLETSSSGPAVDFVLSDEDADALSSIRSASSFYALYPFDKEATASFASSLVKSSVPSVQYAEADRFDPQAFLAVGFSDAAPAGQGDLPRNMRFYNVCGGLCFTLQDPSQYSSIEFFGNENESICGEIEISMSDPTCPSAAASGSAEKKITLVLPDGESFGKNRRYYISLLPGIFPSGFTMNFLDADGHIVRTGVCSSNVSFRRSVFAYVENADDPDKLASIRDGVLLSSGTEAANCYVVSAPGTYKFPLVKGLDLEAALTDAASVEVLWETANTDTAPRIGEIVSDVTINKGMVYFKVPDPVRDGNALIAAKSGDGKILWSWHIWICADYDPDDTAHLLAGKDKPMLDRNLGALSASPSSPLSNGLFYQWGRKDPFPGAADSYVTSDGAFFATTRGRLELVPSGASVDAAYAAAHPTAYITSSDGHWLAMEDNSLWNRDKNDNDPCPAGWKVPGCYSYTSAGHNYAEEAWNDVEYRRYQDPFSGYGAVFKTEDGGWSWYPNTGYISISGELLMVGQYSIYWSWNPMGGNSYGLELSQNMRGELTLNPYQGGKYRGEGHAVRCIKDN